MKKKLQKGFTMVELLTVIGIITILTAVAVPSYGLMKKNVSFSSAVEEVANTLREAQNLSMSSQTSDPSLEAEEWVVGFASDKKSYSLYPVSQYRITEYKLDNGVEIIQGADTEIVFKHLTGTIVSDQQIIVGFPSGQQKTIEVKANGKISIL
jgi:prepilin-type N-terminal cleavage/methylation domain-containing protein